MGIFQCSLFVLEILSMEIKALLVPLKRNREIDSEQSTLPLAEMGFYQCPQVISLPLQMEPFAQAAAAFHGPLLVPLLPRRACRKALEGWEPSSIFSNEEFHTLVLAQQFLGISSLMFLPA